MSVYKSFAGIPVLRGVDLLIPEHTTFVLLGESGSGKTVLLKLVAGLLFADRGMVRVDGKDLGRLSKDELQEVWRKVGILFQSGALFDSMTVLENLALPLRERTSLSTEQINQRALEALRWVGLQDAADLFPAELSGGMRKRAAFARALVLDPKIYLFDEPTAGLDPLTTRSVSDEILLASQNLQSTILAITHDLPTAFRVAHRIGLLHGGKVIGAGTPGQFARCPHPAVRAFLRTWDQQGHELPPP